MGTNLSDVIASEAKQSRATERLTAVALVLHGGGKQMKQPCVYIVASRRNGTL